MAVLVTIQVSPFRLERTASAAAADDLLSRQNLGLRLVHVSFQPGAFSSALFFNPKRPRGVLAL
jgi:hypothetical protein